MAVVDYSMEHLRSSKSVEKLKRVRRSNVLFEGDAAAVRKKFLPGDVVYYIIQIILQAVIVGALIALGKYLYDTSQSQERYDEVVVEYTEEEPIPPREMDPDTYAWPPIVDWERLKTLNPDISGWIRIPGTDVDYPILVNNTRDYYLHHNMYGDYDESGAIFADYQNNQDLNADQHIVLYGHHMNVSTMFHAVALYTDPAFFEAHRVIYYETPETTYVLKPIGAYIARDDEYAARQVVFGNSNEFQSYSDGRLTRSDIAVHDDYDRKTNDMLVTLITCTNAGASRIIVECVMEQSYPTSMVPVVIATALRENGVVLNANGKVEVPADAAEPGA